MKKIESLMVSAGLLEKMSSRIGGTLNGGLSLKGLSGGEKRRLSIVCATLADPQILLLDGKSKINFGEEKWDNGLIAMNA